jgi:hypothetical protein
MAWGNKKDTKPAVSETKKAEPWQEMVDGASPKKSAYFDALRTKAFANFNLVENFVEFWAALKVDDKNDKWRVMHYLAYDLDKDDGKFVSEAATEKDVSFIEAIALLSRNEYTASRLQSQDEFDMEAQYPADKYPELNAHYYNLEHFKNAANIEGIAFDQAAMPYRRVEGKIFASATFQRSEVVKSILAAEQAHDNPYVQEKLEGGILSDIYHTAASPTATLENKLKVGQVLATMDSFAGKVGAFYLGIQQLVGAHDGFDKIEGIQPAEKKDFVARAQKVLDEEVGRDPRADDLVNYLIGSMNEDLETAKSLGVHVEPFQKFSAECELYANLLNASKNLEAMEKSTLSANNVNTGLITEIRESVEKAQRKFLQLGGTQEKMDRLKAWVSNPKKDPIPASLPAFLTRYYTARGNVMGKIQNRKAGVRQLATMPDDVKPGLTGTFNDPKTVAQPAPAGQDNETPLKKPAAGQKGPGQ